MLAPPLPVDGKLMRRKGLPLRRTDLSSTVVDGLCHICRSPPDTGNTTGGPYALGPHWPSRGLNRSQRSATPSDARGNNVCRLDIAGHGVAVCNTAVWGTWVARRSANTPAAGKTAHGRLLWSGRTSWRYAPTALRDGNVLLCWVFSCQGAVVFDHFH